METRAAIGFDHGFSGGIGDQVHFHPSVVNLHPCLRFRFHHDDPGWSGGDMKKRRLLALIWLALSGLSLTAACQQVGVSERTAKCAPQMTEKECQQARLDALFKKMDQAAAAGHSSDTAGMDALTRRYAMAIQAAVRDNWVAPDGLPNAACRVHIVQLLGGTVISASADAGCPFDAKGRQAVVDAVWRTHALPYKGFESVFQRNIDFMFFPPNAQSGVRNRAKFTSGH